MNCLTKKMMIYSLVGIMQVGLGTAAIEASPLHMGNQSIMQLDDRQNQDDERQHEHERRQHEHAEKQRQENERHEREMRRRHHESEREWHERQERENQRHEDALRDIAAILIGIAIGSSND